MAAVIAVPILLIWQKNNVYDAWRLHNYQPPQSIVNLANDDSFKPYTRHLFYVNHPQLISSVAGFRENCPENMQTIVLGCYHPNQRGIYIYDVQDPALAGVQQVTAAHEVLHSVYARLSTEDRNSLNAELEDYYKNGLTDPRVLAEVKLYQQTEPNDVMDEMSCTFGTEIANLPPSLEAYYAKYFTNRQAIVTFEQSYEGEFTSRQNQINADDQRLAQMKQQIQAEEDQLSSQLNSIKSNRSRVESSNDETQINEFNAQVNAYNSGVSRLKADINEYNNLVQSRNAIAADLASLQSALDTRLTTQSAK